MINRPHRKRAGFTLVEVLAALAIFGMILTVAGMMLVSTLRTRRSIEATFRRNNQGTELLNVMSRDLRAAISTGPQSNGRRLFYGKHKGTDTKARDQIDFVTSRNTWHPERETFADISECGYLLKPNRAKPGLFRLYRRSSPWINGNPIRGGTLTLLHKRVVSMNIEYQKGKASGDEGGGSWRDSWDDRSESGALPNQVRITLILQFPPRSNTKKSEPVKRTYKTVVSIKR